MAAQPNRSAPLGAVPHHLTASSSLGPITNADSRAGFNATSWNLPPDAMKIIAQCRASGRFPTFFNQSSAPHPSPSRTTKSFVMAKRPTTRPHSRHSMLKSGGVPTYARGGVPIAKPVPQPHGAAQYQPPPIKARARRSALAERSKDRMNAKPIVIDEPANFLTLTSSSLTNHMQSTFPAAQSAAVAPKARSRVMPTLAIDSAGPAPTAFWIDHAESPSMPALKAGSSRLERAREIAQLPGLRGIPIGLIQQLLPRLEKPERHWNNTSWVAGDSGTSRAGSSGSSKSAGYENPHTPVIQASTMEAPKLPFASTRKSLPPVEPAYEPDGTGMAATDAATGRRVRSAQSDGCSGILDVGHSTELGHRVDTDEARVRDIGASFQDGGWEGFIDFDWFNKE